MESITQPYSNCLRNTIAFFLLFFIEASIGGQLPITYPVFTHETQYFIWSVLSLFLILTYFFASFYFIKYIDGNKKIQYTTSIKIMNNNKIIRYTIIASISLLMLYAFLILLIFIIATVLGPALNAWDTF